MTITLTKERELLYLIQAHAESIGKHIWVTPHDEGIERDAVAAAARRILELLKELPE